MGLFNSAGQGDSEQSDSIIANDMMSGAKAGATAYLMASLEATTPELKSFLFSYVSQMAQAHQGMTELAVKKNWYRPYQDPKQQLSEIYQQSATMLQPNA